MRENSSFFCDLPVMSFKENSLWVGSIYFLSLCGWWVNFVLGQFCAAKIEYHRLLGWWWAIEIYLTCGSENWAIQDQGATACKGWQRTSRGWGQGILVYSPKVERSPADQRKDPILVTHQGYWGFLQSHTTRNSLLSAVHLLCSDCWNLREVTFQENCLFLEFLLPLWGSVDVLHILNIWFGLSQLLHCSTATVSSAQVHVVG